MSLKLWLASRWLSGNARLSVLIDVERQTIGALDALLEKCSPEALSGLRRAQAVPGRTVGDRRASMAAAQNGRVRALVAALGRKEAVRAGREALFPVGVELGKEARKRLGVGQSAGDLETAATALYRALGIDFKLEKRNDGTMILRVQRCALAGYYTDDACEILSAADEGVVAGLNPKYSMRFEQRMTGGSVECLARITEAGK